MNKLYKATVVGPSGGEYAAGLWEVLATPSAVTFRLVTPPHGSGRSFVTAEAFVCRRSGGAHALRDWGDGTYTLYPRRGGTPYVFQPEGA